MALCFSWFGKNELTLLGRVTHICVGNLTIIGSDNGLSPSGRQAIILIKAGILLTDPLGKTSVKFYSKYIYFHSKKCILECRFHNGGHFFSAAMCHIFRINALTLGQAFRCQWRYSEEYEHLNHIYPVLLLCTFDISRSCSLASLLSLATMCWFSFASSMFDQIFTIVVAALNAYHATLCYNISSVCSMTIQEQAQQYIVPIEGTVRKPRSWFEPSPGTCLWATKLRLCRG